MDADGIVVRRYKPGIQPLAITSDLKGLIKTGVVPPKKKPMLNDFDA